MKIRKKKQLLKKQRNNKNKRATKKQNKGNARNSSELLPLSTQQNHYTKRWFVKKQI
jgi:hypothetical protein